MKIDNILSLLRLESGIYYQNDLDRYGVFESDYLRLRQSEGRVYSDDQVRGLPLLIGSPLSKEWKMREKSARRLVGHVRKRKASLIIEIGCGNGWLSNLLTDSGTIVIGVDVNETELRQGSRVFADNRNLYFVYGDIFAGIFDGQVAADLIVLSGAIQYFADLKRLLRRLQAFLAPHGEIHVMDSPIYDSHNVAEAAARTKTYFMERGVTGEQFYFHHTWKVLDDFDYTILYDPNSAIGRIQRTIIPDSPFCWIKIIS